MKKEAAETLLFEREKLYEEIWAAPMMQVAKRYGISDVGLAKICKKMSIPRPPRGYWAKKSHGVKTKRESLRPATIQTQTIAVVERTDQHLAKINDQRRIQAPEFASERQKVRRLKIALRDIEIARRTRQYLETMQALSVWYINRTAENIEKELNPFEHYVAWVCHYYLARAAHQGALWNLELNLAGISPVRELRTVFDTTQEHSGCGELY